MPFERTARALIASRAAEGTRELYTLDLSRWLAYCELEKVNPADPPMEAATKFRDNMKGANLTIRRTLSALSKMYRAAVANRVATWNPFDADALPRPPGDVYARTETVDEDVVKKILTTTAHDLTPLGVRDLAMLRILYDTGLRRETVALLLKESVTRRAGIVILRGVRIKGGKRGDVELPKTSTFPLLGWLEKAPDGERVFGDITPSAVNKVLKKRARQAGFAKLKLHPHQFRATFITEALDSGESLHDVQAAVHHANPSTTMRYDRGKRGEGVTSAVAKFRRGK